MCGVITQSISENKGCFLKAYREKSNALDVSVATILEYNLPFSKETKKRKSLLMVVLEFLYLYLTQIFRERLSNQQQDARHISSENKVFDKCSFAYWLK